MSYNKTTWANGDIITAQKLNNIESGVVKAESPFTTICVNNDTDPTEIEGITWAELLEKSVAVNSITNVKARNEYNMFLVKEVSANSDRNYYGGTWNCVAIDANDGGLGDVTRLYYASLIGGVYPTADRQGHTQKYKAWDLIIDAPQIAEGKPTVHFLGSVGPNEINPSS